MLIDHCRVCIGTTEIPLHSDGERESVRVSTAASTVVLIQCVLVLRSSLRCGIQPVKKSTDRLHLCTTVCIFHTRTLCNGAWFADWVGWLVVGWLGGADAAVIVYDVTSFVCWVC
jgi:hypothetical protein